MTRAGWIRVSAISPSAPGEILDAHIADEDLVIWRTADGRLCVSDARCPHNWSHLGSQGAVDGDELVCLTHGWRFGPDGRGWTQDASGGREPAADLRVWASDERVDGVWVQLPRP